MLDLTYCSQMYDQFMNIYALHCMLGTSYQDCTYIPYPVFLLEGKVSFYMKNQKICKFHAN